MTGFIRLTGDSEHYGASTEIHLRTDAITFLRWVDGVTCIGLVDGGEYWQVRETPDQIMTLIAASEGRVTGVPWVRIADALNRIHSLLGELLEFVPHEPMYRRLAAAVADAQGDIEQVQLEAER